MARALKRDGQAIIAALAEQQDCLDAVAAGLTSLVHALLLAGITEDEITRLVVLTAEATS